MRDLARRRFKDHRSHAKERGVPFLLTFDEWWGIWEKSGHWRERGARRGRYVMSRSGDRGAYEVGNVRVCLFEENRAEQQFRGSSNPFFGRRHSAAARAKVSAALLGNKNHARQRRGDCGRFVSSNNGDNR